MVKKYKVDLSNGSQEDILNQLKRIEQAISSDAFKEDIKKNCTSTLTRVMNEKDINSIEEVSNSANQEKVAKYKKANKSYIEGNTITLYNDAFLTNDEMTHFFNTNNRDKNYQGFSIAELVEYGSGLKGSSSSKGTRDEWNYGSRKGWVYKGDSDEDKVFTRGSEGKYIYYTTTQEIDDKICDWVTKYLDKELGSGLKW